ncbi:uncharacterized protein LOC143236847 [Tachypleus tridentatus]|uniref:uncharacterized protein LOC143236847 n=1 Tax=Tachypleus tridentatus TaxID=6853 RepID=UPI003FD1A34E
MKGRDFVCWAILLSWYGHKSTRGQEIQERTACSHDEITVNCENGSFIAVRNAIFSTDFQNKRITCVRKDQNQSACLEDIRVPVNNVCSGKNNCIYNHVDNYRTKCTGIGLVMVMFVCVQESQVQRFCNVNVRRPRGYISSPRYPLFYPKLDSCKWNIEGEEGQTVLVQILDISTTLPRRHYGRPVCDDGLTVTEEDDRKLLTTCGDTLDSLKEVESQGNRLKIHFHSTQFKPLRGFLLRYQLKNCPTLPAPKLGYLVHRNDSSALYMCCKGHVFNDTMENVKVLSCIDSEHWNSLLPPCIPLEDQKETRNNSNLHLTFTNFTMTNDQPIVLHRVVDNIPANETFLEYKEISLVVDIWVPSILMVALLVGNVFIIIFIIKLRRKTKTAEEHELEPKPSSMLEPAPSEV